MKVLTLSNLFEPFIRGGAERVVGLQAELLARAGNDVVVLTTTPDGSMPESAPEPHLVVRRFRPRYLYHTLQDTHQPFWKRIIWHLQDAFDPYAAALTSAAIEAEKPDVIFTHNMKGFGLQAFRAIRKSGVPHVHTFHDLQLLLPSGLKMFGGEANWQARGFLHRHYVAETREILGSPTIVMSPSRYLLDEYKREKFFPNSRTEILPNPVGWDAVNGNETIAMLPRTILYAGQLEPHKGLRVLLHAHARVPEAKLIIVGGGSMEKELETYAKAHPSVELHGRLSPAKLFVLMRQVSLVAVPSLCYENTPNVVLEALTLGTPVVASKIGGIPEMMQDGDGELCEPENAEALARALSSTLDRVPDRHDIALRAKRFSRATYQKRLFEILEGLKC